MVGWVGPLVHAALPVDTLNFPTAQAPHAPLLAPENPWLQKHVSELVPVVVELLGQPMQEALPVAVLMVPIGQATQVLVSGPVNPMLH